MTDASKGVASSKDGTEFERKSAHWRTIISNEAIPPYGIFYFEVQYLVKHAVMGIGRILPDSNVRVGKQVDSIGFRFPNDIHHNNRHRNIV